MVLIGSPLRLRSLLYIISLTAVLTFATLTLLWTDAGSSSPLSQWLPHGGDKIGQDVVAPYNPSEAQLHKHPIEQLMQDARERFLSHISDRSATFTEAVEKYRTRHGRHPPPGYKEWYKFARKHHVYDIDDFDQINGDLRPFWAIKPSVIRQHAAHAVDDPAYGNSVLAVRNGHIYLPNEHWRPEAFIHLLEAIAQYLPDMDIILNNLDQPRVVVPWEDLQEMLRIEESSRSREVAGVEDQFTKGMSNYWVPSEAVPDRSWVHWFGIDRFHNELKVPDAGNDPAPDYGWIDHRGKQYMDVCSRACPPESYARNATSKQLYQQAEKQYKHTLGGFITNFNLSSDICTVGHQLSDLHGMLYASTSLLTTSKLVPIFSECKVSVNNDILYPANMYYKRDKRYEYTSKADVKWDRKEDLMIWRGVTAGGTTRAEEGDKWKKMQRQRLVLLTNSTVLGDEVHPILALSDASDPNEEYSMKDFRPAAFAETYTDTGFTEKQACIPNCDFYDSSLRMVKPSSFAETFRSKYLIDVDGMSFSGRWRAFLQSRSLGLKATIFREWHDTRLFAWQHFIPMDNRYDDLYSLLTYFIGTEQEAASIVVPRHDAAAFATAENGREWAAKVLRREDIEIYMYRLLLEYGRIIDDNRDRIGFVGDGGEEMKQFDKQHPAIP